MDQYQQEIQGIRRTLSRLRADRAQESLIQEYEAELRNLVALYQAASDAYERGESEPPLRLTLAELGFGDWTLEHVYDFVYEAAMDAELGGRDFANVVSHTDYAESLRAAQSG